jgi:hypothetical protein
MTNSIPKADITQVKIGLIEIEGLLLPDGSFAIAVPQICSLFQFLNKNAVRDIKALLGKNFQFLKCRTTLHPKAVNVLQLKDFEKLMFELIVQKQNAKAIDLGRQLAGLSLHQLFSDAFGIKFEQEERQAWLKARQEGKIVRRTLTDAIKTYIDTHSDDLSEPKKKFYYKNVTDAVYIGIFDRTASKLKVDWVTRPIIQPITCKHGIRNKMTNRELKYVEQVEDLAMRLIDYDYLEPMTAVYEALNRLRIPLQTQ